MRIAIDTRSLLLPLTGVGHFVHRLLEAMLPLLSPDQELLSFNGWRLEPLDAEYLSRVASLNSSRNAEHFHLSPRYAARKAYLTVRQITPVRRTVRMMQAQSFHGAERNFDLFHAVNYVPPAACHKAILPFIHDLSHIRYPHAHPKERVEWLESKLRLVVALPYLQTSSEFSKSEIVNVLGVASDRIYVTYPAPGACFKAERDGDDAVLAKRQLAVGRFFLVVGTREPRKNVKTVAEAYTRLPAATQARFPFVWAGPPGWGDLALSPAVENAKRAGRICLTGYVPDHELAALYRNAALFIMPSIYEGFGMPVIEAMACNARIAVSNIPVFMEVAGSHTQYVEPLDVDGWRNVMAEASEADARRSEKRGLAPDLARFSWKKSAAVTLDLYRRLKS